MLSLALGLAALAAYHPGAAAAAPSGAALAPALCGPGALEPTLPPAYYAIDLVPTGRVPGSRNANGTAAVTFPRSPFGVTISPAGTYVQALEIRARGLPTPRQGGYVAWVTTTDLKEVERLGELGPEGLRATVSWNKFLVVVSLEAGTDGLDRWQGPIVLRGMSRSGRMHTMAGHGPFEGEPCARYGY